MENLLGSVSSIGLPFPFVEKGETIEKWEDENMFEKMDEIRRSIDKLAKVVEEALKGPRPTTEIAELHREFVKDTTSPLNDEEKDIFDSSDIPDDCHLCKDGEIGKYKDEYVVWLEKQYLSLKQKQAEHELLVAELRVRYR